MLRSFENAIRAVRVPTNNRQRILHAVFLIVRIFHGLADDYVPAAECRAYVVRPRKAGKDITLTEYPGAYHVLDNPVLKTPVQLPQAQASRRDYWRGCVGAMEYSLACPETTVTFVAVRYLLGIAITACAGCWLRPKTLQW
ncbi:MAG: DUF1109 family protein [Rhodocyclaceae bacterium]|nr:DUF1109 family protein [Rhodocyclaceae bacterium]